MTAQPDGLPQQQAPGPGTDAAYTQRTYRIALTRVTSYVIMTQQRRAVHTGTLDQIEAAYRSAQTHCATLGWWGIPFGLIWTPIALFRNSKNMKQIRALAAAPSAAAEAG